MEYFGAGGDVADLVVPGTTFEEIVRAAFRRGMFPDAGDDEDAWVAARLEVPTLLTAHYPKGIGPVVAELRELAPPDGVLEKIHFDAASESACAERFAALDRPQPVIAGTEAHVCVLQTALGLKQAGYEVAIISPIGTGYEKKHEIIDGIHVFRHPLPLEASGGAPGYALEYSLALFWEFVLTWRVWLTRGFDAIHACNPPDTIFLVGLFFKLFRKKFVFDHHDINPELYVAKFGRRDFFYRVICRLERWTFRAADVSIATNESYKRIAIERGGMDPDRVFVVRSGPDLRRLRILSPVERLKRGRQYLVGYVGVMGKQEGIDYLLRAVRHIVHDLKRTDVHFGLVGGGTELEELKRTAKELDVDGSGSISARELGLVIGELDHDVTPRQIHEMIAEVDLDGSGTIDFEEFQALMVSERGDRDARLRVAFEILDADQVMQAFDERIADGYTVGDWQYAIDENSDDYLHKGVFSCYRPVPFDTKIQDDQVGVSDRVWGAQYRINDSG